MDILVIVGLVVACILFGLAAIWSKNKTNAKLFWLTSFLNLVSVCLKVLTLTL